MHRLFSLSIATSALVLPSLSLGQVVITEIMYHPQSVALYNDVDWVEVYNNSGAPVDMENWMLFDQFFLLKDKDPTTAPEPFNASVFSGGVIDGSSTLFPGEVAVIMNGRTRLPDDFREKWSLPPTVKIIAPDWGQEFDMEGNPTGVYYPDTNTISSESSDPEWITLADSEGNWIDTVDYRNGYSSGGGWPNAGSNSDPNGGSIYLKTDAITSGDASVNNDSGYNWALSVSGVGGAVNQLKGGFIYSEFDVGSPGSIDGLVDVFVPESSSVGFLMGLAMLFGMRRRR